MNMIGENESLETQTYLQVSSVTMSIDTTVTFSIPSLSIPSSTSPATTTQTVNLADVTINYVGGGSKNNAIFKETETITLSKSLKLNYLRYSSPIQSPNLRMCLYSSWGVKDNYNISDMFFVWSN